MDWLRGRIGRRRLRSFDGGSGVHAESVNLATAQARAGFPVSVPTSALASPTEIRRIWLVRRPDNGGNIVALEYPKLEVTTAPIATTFDSARAYREMVKQHTDPGATTQMVSGVLAYVAPPVDTGSVHRPGYLAFTKNHIQTTIEGYYSPAELRAITESIR